MPLALHHGERWSLDFVSGTFGASRKFRMLAVNDDCCRENADTSISGARVARELDALEGGTGAGCASACLWQAYLHCQ